MTITARLKIKDNDAFASLRFPAENLNNPELTIAVAYGKE
jgi:hypothetical protein